MKRIAFIITLLFIVIFLGRSLNPFSSKMFTFHDETQAARVQQFVLNIKNLQIPPRIAPDFSFKLGYPIFNYYSPFPYWITSILHLTGISVINSLKISFLLAIVVGFVSMFLLLRLFFNFYPSLLAATLYVSSPWLAVEIFIRGNLAETWFIALLPAGFWCLYKNQKNLSSWFFIITVIILSFILTSHNILSIVFVPIIIAYIFLLPNKRKNYFALFFSFLISAYFFLPAIIELPLTYAGEVAKNNNYSGDLLCLWQLWTTPFWGYGGSIPGCSDGMSFMLGKPQIIFGIIGLFFLVRRLFFQKKDKAIFIFFTLLLTVSIYFSTNLSLLISGLLEPFLSFFQFPWRLLAFALFGICFVAAGIEIPKRFKKVGFVFVLLAYSVIIYNSKFFIKDLMTNEKFNKDFLSSTFIEKMVAYKVAEYVPKTVDYKNWFKYESNKGGSEIIDPTLNDGKFIHSLDKGILNIINNSSFYKQATTTSNKIILNISYMPYWKIYINDIIYIPTKLDKLGRPIIGLSKPSTIKVKYEQTTVEKVGNAISIIALLGLITIVTLFHGFIVKRQQFNNEAMKQ